MNMESNSVNDMRRKSQFEDYYQVLEFKLK